MATNPYSPASVGDGRDDGDPRTYWHEGKLVDPRTVQGIGGTTYGGAADPNGYVQGSAPPNAQPAPTYSAPPSPATPGGAAPAPGPSPAPAPVIGGAVWGGTNPAGAPGAAPAPSGAPAPAPAAAPAPGIISGAAQLGSPSAWNVTSDQTVEGRIQSIINPNNPIMQQARARATDAMNSRGLMNSSLAITAADSAAYDAAIPIATADAATAAKAAGYNVDQSNQFAVRNTDADNAFRLQDKADVQAREIAMINRETQKQLTTLDADLRAKADAFAAENKTLLETNAQAAQAYNTAMSAINNIQMNAGMDTDAKTMATASVWRDLQTQYKVMGAVAGLNLNSQLNFSNYPGFDAQGNYVGFEDGPGARTRGNPAAPGAAPPAPAPQPGDPGYQPDYGGSGD